MQQSRSEGGEPLVLMETSVPMPKSVEALVDRLTTLFTLPRVESVEVRVDTIRAHRWMPAGTAPNEVVPDWVDPDTFSADVLLERVLEHLEEIPAEKLRNHPHLQLLEATQRLERRGLVPVAILAPKGPLMASWLGSEVDIGAFYLGCRMVRGDGARYSEKIVVLGAPAPHGRLPRMDDVVGAVAIDIGEGV